MKKVANLRHRWLRWSAVVSGAAFVVLVTAGCETTCPRGLAKLNNRCQAVDGDGGSADGAVNTSDPDGGKGTLTSGVNRAGAGAAGRSNAGSPSSAPQAGAGGAEPAAGGGARAEPSTGPAGSPAAPVDVCADAAGESVCDGAELHRCSAAGVTTNVQSCEDATLCQTGAPSGVCASCDPGAFRCEGARLDVCDQTGQFGLQEMCATPALCKADAGACTELLCQPNAVTCSSDRSALNTCNATGSEFADVQSCGDPGCDQANERCNICRPGAKSCSGQTLLTCNNDGQAQQMTQCVPVDSRGCATASCEGTGCVYGHKPPGSSCSGGKCNNTGACVACITNNDCPAPAACFEASCSANGSCDTQQKPDGTACGDNRICRQGTCEAPPKTLELRMYWNGERADNFTTSSAAGAQAALDFGYTFIRTEGYVFETSQPGTVPLKLYYNGERADNFTTATAEGEAAARGAAYGYVRIEGYVYETAQPGTVPLRLYWNGERGDNFCTATSAGESDALAFNYTFIRVEGYVLSNP